MNKQKEKKINKFIIRNLGKKNLLPWLSSALLDWLIIVLAFLLVSFYTNPISVIFTIFVVGNRQHALSLLGHDGSHRMLTKSAKWNDFISDFFSFWPVGLTTSGYRNVHFPHHKHLNTSHDPELKHRASKAPQWNLPITIPKILVYSVYDLFGYSLPDYLMIFKFAKPSSKSPYYGLVIWHALFIAGLSFFNLYLILAIWYCAIPTTLMMFMRIRTWTEHQGSDDTHRLHMNLIEGAILAPHGSWHHYEHHLYPSVPLHRLKYVRRLLKDEPVITLRDLINRHRKAQPIVSGTPLKEQSNS